jgi:integrase
VSGEVRPSGHLQVVDRGGGRRWHALWRDADGRHQKVLGPAWVKDSGKRTPRGAIVWRAANGPKPDPSHLTPAEATDRLHIYSREEIDAIVRCAADDQDTAIILTAALTGLRRGELLALRWRDIDFPGQAICVWLAVGRSTRQGPADSRPPL